MYRYGISFSKVAATSANFNNPRVLYVLQLYVTHTVQCTYCKPMSTLIQIVRKYFSPISWLPPKVTATIISLDTQPLHF